MLRIFLWTFLTQAALCIIVTDPPPKAEYKYSYDIVDPTTGDTKSLYESKLGDVVRGSYSVVDPDGIKRIVDYTAGAKTGFKAVIRNELLPHSNIFHGIPYSSLYHAQNFNIQPIGKSIVPIPYVQLVRRPLQTKQVTYFSPGKGKSIEQPFQEGEYFKPNYYHK